MLNLQTDGQISLVLAFLLFRCDVLQEQLTQTQGPSLPIMTIYGLSVVKTTLGGKVPPAGVLQCPHNMTDC